MVTHFSPPASAAPLPHAYAQSAADIPTHRRSSRAPSISSQSRASTSRRHRHHHRSAPQNEFPVFSETGDVEIIITSGPDRRYERRYLLHRLILSQSAGFFDAALSANHAGTGLPSIPGGSRHMRGPSLSSIGEEDEHTTAGSSRSRWRYELDWGEPGEHTPPILVPRDAAAAFTSTSNARPKAAGTAQASPHDPLDDPLKDYDNLFRIFYNHAPHLDSINIATAYVECKALLALADTYDALPIVGPRVDHHLLRFQGRLWKQIAKYPPSYLKLGYQARSKPIFAEALVHVVGQWPAGREQLRHGQVSPAVLDLIDDKLDDMDARMARVDGRLWRLSLTTARGERVSPAASWTDWLAVSLWRQWFAENTTPAPPVAPAPPPASSAARRPSNSRSRSHSYSQPPPPPLQTPSPLPSLGRVYRLIGAGGEAYLGHDELKRFFKLRPEPYSRDALRRFERRVDELKAMAAEIVRPLLRSHLEMDVGGSAGSLALPYLTCTRIDQRDFVWEEDEGGEIDEDAPGTA